ncbi:MAG: hypothetical protein V4674_00780 [Patescibacteria group bacterium]
MDFLHIVAALLAPLNPVRDALPAVPPPQALVAQTAGSFPPPPPPPPVVRSFSNLSPEQLLELQEHLRTDPPTVEDLRRMSPEQIRELQAIQAITPGSAPIVAPPALSKPPLPLPKTFPAQNTTGAQTSVSASAQNPNVADRIEKELQDHFGPSKAPSSAQMLIAAKKNATALDKKVAAFKKKATKLPKSIGMPSECTEMLEMASALTLSLRAANAETVEDIDQSDISDVMLQLGECDRAVTQITAAATTLPRIKREIASLARTNKMDLTEVRTLFGEAQSAYAALANPSLDDVDLFADKLQDLLAKMQSVRGNSPKVSPTSFIEAETSAAATVFGGAWTLFKTKFLGL